MLTIILSFIALIFLYLVFSTAWILLLTFALLQQRRDDRFILYRVERAGGVHHPPTNSQLFDTTHGYTQLEPGEHAWLLPQCESQEESKPIPLFSRCDKPLELTRGDGGCCWLSISSTHRCSSSWCHRHCTTKSRQQQQLGKDSFAPKPSLTAGQNMQLCSVYNRSRLLFMRLFPSSNWSYSIFNPQSTALLIWLTVGRKVHNISANISGDYDCYDYLARTGTLH